MELGSPLGCRRGPGRPGRTPRRGEGVADNRQANIRLVTTWGGGGLLSRVTREPLAGDGTLKSKRSAPRPARTERTVPARARSGRRRRARARPRGQPPAVDDAAEEEAAAAARSGGLKRRPAATGRRRDELGGRPRLGAVRGSGPGVGGGGGAAGGQRSFLAAAAAAAVAMRGTARPGPPCRGRLLGARGLRVPPPPLLLLLALLPLQPAPGAAAAPAPRPPALLPAAAGPSVSLYLSEDEVRRLIGEWGRPRRGGQVGPGPRCFRPSAAQSARGGPWAGPRLVPRCSASRPSTRGRLRGPASACRAGWEVWSLPRPSPGSAFWLLPCALAASPPKDLGIPWPPRNTGVAPHSLLHSASPALHPFPRVKQPSSLSSPPHQVSLTLSMRVTVGPCILDISKPTFDVDEPLNPWRWC